MSNKLLESVKGRWQLFERPRIFSDEPNESLPSTAISDILKNELSLLPEEIQSIGVHKSIHLVSNKLGISVFQTALTHYYNSDRNQNPIDCLVHPRIFLGPKSQIILALGNHFDTFEKDLEKSGEFQKQFMDSAYRLNEFNHYSNRFLSLIFESAKFTHGQFSKFAMMEVVYQDEIDKGPHRYDEPKYEYTFLPFFNINHPKDLLELYPISK